MICFPRAMQFSLPRQALHLKGSMRAGRAQVRKQSDGFVCICANNCCEMEDKVAKNPVGMVAIRRKMREN
eukprot:2836854-Amphidinium_carterae.1